MRTSKTRKWWVFHPVEVMVLAIPILAIASLHISRVPLWAGLQLVGRAGECSVKSAMAAERAVTEANATTEQIMSRSRIVQEDKAVGLVQWETPHGNFWAPPDTSVPFLLSEQIHGFYGTGARRVQPGDVVLDCGANIGAFVWEALRAGASKVVAIEPSERNVESLRRNFGKEIEAGRVIVYPKGVWHQDETLTFHVFGNSALDSIVMTNRVEENKTPRKVSIEVTTIDRIVTELELDRVDFIKMDVEGAERKALDGARATIMRFAPRMSVATENLADDPQVIPVLVSKLRPTYRRECGQCRVRSLIEIQPEVFYFY
jgi:FkbM family methyltransferase